MVSRTNIVPPAICRRIYDVAYIFIAIDVACTPSFPATPIYFVDVEAVYLGGGGGRWKLGYVCHLYPF